MDGLSKILLLVFFLLFFPVLEVSGHFIPISEFVIYLLVLLNWRTTFFKQETMAYLWYAFLSFAVYLLTALLNNEGLNNHDLFQIRHAIMFVSLYAIFQKIVPDSASYKVERIDQFLLKLSFILTLPALVVLLQKINPLGFRDLIVDLYKPQFFYLGSEVFDEFRYTSIFKDFFTEAIYFISTSIVMTSLILRRSWIPVQKFFLFSLLLFMWMMQIYVSRTSFAVIPLVVGMLVLIEMVTRKKIVQALMMIAIFVALLVTGLQLLQNVNESDLFNAEWIKEIALIVSGNQSESTSFQQMNDWISIFYAYISTNLSVLFYPHHTYALTDQSSALYSDSFYVQEIYRYGIYGVFSYFVFIIASLYQLRHYYPLLLWILIAFVLNYKGGNVFLMNKTIFAISILYFVTVTFLYKRGLSEKT